MRQFEVFILAQIENTLSICPVIYSFIHSCSIFEHQLPGASMRNPAHGKGHEEETRQAKASQISREPPWTYSSIYPQTRICLPYYIMPFTNSSDINRGLSPHHLFLEKVNLELLDNKSPGHNKNVSIPKPLWWLSSLPDRFVWPHVIVHSLPTVRGTRCNKLSKYRFFWELRKLLV